MTKIFESDTEEYKISEMLKVVIDPELGVNIIDLGLVYEIKYVEDERIDIDMTLSTPACPLGDVIISNVQQTLQRNYSNYLINVQLVWEPEWSPEMVSQDGKDALNLF